MRPAGPFADVDLSKTHDLSQGLAPTTFTFQANHGATGHIRFLLRDTVTGQASVLPSLCIAYDVVNEDPANGTSSRQSGSQGSCGTNGFTLNANNPQDVAPRLLLDWAPTRAHYTLTVSAEPQANELVVDIAIDNP